MIIPHAAPVILHRMAIMEAREHSATGALIAKFRGDAINKATIERLNALDKPQVGISARLDKTA
ncbi:hypothetical protein [Pelagibacterium xiamenense]|uniref:hypothetical protein n=1 Tax=Pelagibacterium xiamenense TaxID=2901140 RepID=UPI001E600ADE|nr:hypothetical protein [Pelagibacterium xiamenense]MCD7061301.1 hypothetical protein [Pelagibacterium xiamenense]